MKRKLLPKPRIGFNPLANPAFKPKLVRSGRGMGAYRRPVKGARNSFSREK